MIIPVKKQLGSLNASVSAGDARKIQVLKGELKRLKDEWVTWEDKRQKAARDRMIRLGHENGP